MKGIAWGRLLRLSLAPSAAADALAGITIGAWGAFPLDARVLLVAAGSLCVFHGGMALNDWADREGDARTRPDRPIPSGAVPAASALSVAVALLVLGPMLCVFAAPLAGACLAAVALTAALYDLVGRGAWLGPTLLGLCRAGNLASGVFAGAALSGPYVARLAGLDVGRVPNWAWLACALYGLYVFCASRLARLEDDEDAHDLGSRPTFALLSAAACLAVVPWTVLLGLDALVDSQPGAWTLRVLWLAPAILLGLVSAGLLAAQARTGGAWTRERVGRATGMSLRRLLVFSSICTWCGSVVAIIAGAGATSGTDHGLMLAPLLLLGYPIALGLRRVFPPT